MLHTHTHSQNFLHNFKKSCILQQHNIVNKRQTRSSQHSQECKDSCWQCFCDSWPWPFHSKLNGFPGLIVERCQVLCHVWWLYLHWLLRYRAEKQTNGSENPISIRTSEVSNDTKQTYNVRVVYRLKQTLKTMSTCKTEVTVSDYHISITGDQHPIKRKTQN